MLELFTHFVAGHLKAITQKSMQTYTKNMRRRLGASTKCTYKVVEYNLITRALESDDEKVYVQIIEIMHTFLSVWYQLLIILKLRFVPQK